MPRPLATFLRPLPLIVTTFQERRRTGPAEAGSDPTATKKGAWRSRVGPSGPSGASMFSRIWTYGEPPRLWAMQALGLGSDDDEEDEEDEAEEVELGGGGEGRPDRSCHRSKSHNRSFFVATARGTRVLAYSPERTIAGVKAELGERLHVCPSQANGVPSRWLLRRLTWNRPRWSRSAGD